MVTKCAAKNTQVKDKGRKLETGSDAVVTKTKKSLKLYTWEAASQGDEAATGYYSASYISMYGGSEGLGLLGSMINLFSGLLYIKLPAAAAALGSRKKAVLVIGFLDAITWLPLVLAFLFCKSLPLPAFIALWVISIVPAIIITPVLFSWVSDMVPVNKRGRYFGMRAIIGGASYIGTFYLLGVVLNLFSRREEMGFAIIFLVAFVGQMISWFVYQRMYEPKQTAKSDDCFGFTDFLKVARHNNLGKFIIYISLLNFTIYLALPFLSVYILEDLGYSYSIFTMLMLCQITGKLLSLGLWGKFSDLRGNLQLIAVASIMAPIVPIFFLVSHNCIFLIFAMIFSGVVWAGLDLCAPNFVYEAAPAGRGMKYVSYYKGLSSIAMAVGILLGGYLATHIFPIMDFKVLTLFLVSGFLSLVVVVTLLPRLSEVRPLAHWKPRTPKAKWGLSYHRTGPQKATMPSLQYQSASANAGCATTSSSSMTDNGDSIPCKGLYYVDTRDTYWGKPMPVSSNANRINIDKKEKDVASSIHFDKPVVGKSTGQKNMVEKTGLYYRPREWEYYWSRTSSSGPDMGIGAKVV